MSHYMRLGFIGLLMLAIGLWVGVSSKPNLDEITGCDASLQWCLSQDQSTQLQVIGAAQGSMLGQPIVTPALIHINAKGITADRLVGRITGVNMYMGQFDVAFKPNNGQWQGLTSLPSCIDTHPMVWKVELFVAANPTLNNTVELTPTNIHFLFSSHQPN